VNRLCAMVFILLMALFTKSMFAQQTSLAGMVMDTQGASIPNANVHLEEVGGGASFNTVSDAKGTYTFPSLRAADYKIRVEVPGFAITQRQVTILIGQSLSVDFSLPLATSMSTIEVTAGTSAISTTTSEVAGNVDPVQMKEVPLNGRNWLELALLLPGIAKNDVDSNSPAGGADGGKFQINLDGQQTTQDLAGSSFGQPRYSRDALSQYQIITNRFDATQGRSLNLQVNAQTKSGTDAFHGSAYGYFRNDALIAKDFVAKTNLPYSDQQYGGTVGGPILRAKLWFFGGYEGERTPQTYFMQPTNFGGKSFTASSTTSISTALARVDLQQSDKSRFSLRVTGFSTSNPMSGLSGSSHPSRAVKSAVKNTSSIADWNYIPSSHLVNDLRVGFTYFNYSNSPLYPSQEVRWGGISIGAPYNYPGLRFSNMYSIRDDAFWTKGRHSIKMGAEYLNAWDHGISQQNFNGTVTAVKSTPADLSSFYPVATDPTTWNLAAISPFVSTYVQGFGSPSLSIYRSSAGLWFQDDWKVLARLTLNLGIRYDLDVGLMDSGPVLKSGLEIPHNNDLNNVAPRVGFAYDVFGSHKTVIRGGVGIYYGDVEANQYYNQQLFNGQTTVQASASAGTGTINLAKPFGNATGADFLNETVIIPQAVQLIQPGVITPWAGQGSMGVAQQIGSKWTVQADYVKFRIHHEWERIDQNQSLNPVTGFSATKGSSVAYTDAHFTNILRFITPKDAAAMSDALLVDVRRSFTNGFTIASAYTLSRLKGSSEGAFYVPNNQFNLHDEWAPSAGDQRHTFNVNGLWKLRYGFQVGGLYRYGSGQSYAVTSGSNPFFNGTTSNRTFLSTAKVYNDPASNYASTAAGYSQVKRNSFYGRAIYRVDSRLQKTFTIQERYKLIGIAEVFNMLNHPNYGAYNTQITSASYGTPQQTTSQSYAPRTIQFAARFEF
jgi:hypothetical protein